MRSTPALVSAAAALAFGLAGLAYAAENQESTKVPGTGVEDQNAVENPGALQAPEKDESTGTGATGGLSDESTANVPGTTAEGDPDTENPGALSAPEKD